MVDTSGVQDTLYLVVLSLRPLRVHGTTKLDQGAPDTEQTEGDDGFLVDDIVLAADGVDGETGGGGEDGGFGDERVTGQRVDDGLGLHLGLRHTRSRARSRQRRGNGRQSGARVDGRAKGGTCEDGACG